MRKFEVHITGKDSSINEALNNLNIKNIIVDLLTPELKVLRTEYMSSFICEFNTYEECYSYVMNLANLLPNVIRIKIESPVYDDYINQSIYIESHFKYLGDTPVYPISKNVKSGKLMGTDRVYVKSEYDSFINKWQDHEVELCLFDDYVREDFDWFKLYSIKKYLNTGTYFLDKILSGGIPSDKIICFIGKSKL